MADSYIKILVKNNWVISHVFCCIGNILESNVLHFFKLNLSDSI